MRSNPSRLTAAVLSTLLSTGAIHAQEWPGTPSADRYSDAAGTISMALAGDAIITRRLSMFQESAFTGLLDVVRDATVSVVNLEMLFHRYEPDVIPASQSGGAYMAGDPILADPRLPRIGTPLAVVPPENSPLVRSSMA